jgi:hypothetical protein
MFSSDVFTRPFMRKIQAVLLLLLFAAPMAAGIVADWRTLRGTYAVTPKNYLDPSDEEPKDSHLRMQLSGDTAKALYDAMKVTASPDVCTGAVAKRVGEMQCLYYRGEKKYACSFSVDIMRQKIEYGIAC